MGISQPALAKSLAITFQQIQKYERGSNRIVASRLYRLSRVLKVPVQYFFQDLVEGERTQTGTAGREGGGASPERVPDLLAKRDTLGLVRNYNKIQDPDVRRQICALVKTLGEGVSDPDL